MLHKLFLTVLVAFICQISFSQSVYLTRNGTVSFFSSAPLENIEAVNHQVAGVIDIMKGEMVFVVLMRAFKFEKALMQEHFNENYVESDKYPKATFKGNIVNLKDIDFKKNGVYKAIVEGELMIHGISKKVKHEGTLEVSGQDLKAKSQFEITVADFEIKIPRLVRDNIAEKVLVTVNMPYTLQLKK